MTATDILVANGMVLFVVGLASGFGRLGWVACKNIEFLELVALGSHPARRPARQWRVVSHRRTGDERSRSVSEDCGFAGHAWQRRDYGSRCNCRDRLAVVACARGNASHFQG